MSRSGDIATIVAKDSNTFVNGETLEIYRQPVYLSQLLSFYITGNVCWRLRLVKNLSGDDCKNLPILFDYTSRYTRKKSETYVLIEL